MFIDLHNHTPLCNHATGSPREYIKRAIELNIDIFGFSDHAPMDFDKEYRMDFEQMKEYEKEIRDLADEYSNFIDIRLGYEVDYLKGYIDNRVLDANVDYLIGSVHFIDMWGFDNPEFIGRYKEVDINELWESYFKAIEEMAESRLFNIVGHIDLIKVFNYKPDRDIRELAEGALDAIAKSAMVMELNVAGLRKPVKEIYPSLDILKMAKSRDIAITFGSDAHSIEQVGWKKEALISLAKEAGYSKIADFRNKQMSLIKF